MIDWTLGQVDNQPGVIPGWFDVIGGGANG